MSTTSTNPDYSGDCDYACLPLTTALIHQLRARQASFDQAKRQDNYLDSLTYWGSPVRYLHAAELRADHEEWYDAVVAPLEDYQILSTLPFNPDDLAQRVEVSRTHLDHDGVWWSATPKHTDLTVETLVVPFERLFDETLYLTLSVTDSRSRRRSKSADRRRKLAR